MIVLTDRRSLRPKPQIGDTRTTRHSPDIGVCWIRQSDTTIREQDSGLLHHSVRKVNGVSGGETLWT
jgi:hypothetical protein